VVRLAEALDLSEPEALRLGAELKAFDEKRRPLRQQLRESLGVLKKAAKGEPASQPSVDAAVRQVLETRQRLASLDQELYASLSKNLDAQKRARLGLILAKKGKKAFSFSR
jgi:hypothetical protein